MHKETGKSELPNDAVKRREARLNRFSPEFRERIAALTCCAPEAEDLTESFPALLVALVSDFATPEARERAFDTIVTGGSVKTAAKLLKLPLWLKRIPAEAFRQPIRKLPSEAQFSAKITNFIPEKTNVAGDWLEQVSFASDACDSSFALWAAKHCHAIAPSRRKFVFPVMASWAWHAKHPETVGHRLIERPWSAKMGLRRATEELMSWRRRAEMACLLGDGIEDAWLEPGQQGEYEFIPLKTLEDFLMESRSMNNCLDQYADRLCTGLIRIFSVRRNNRRIADIEIGPITARDGLPTIVQIKGPSNRQAPTGVWRAAHAWLMAQPLDRLPAKPGFVRAADPFEQSQFWRPYLDWLPQERRLEFQNLVISGRRPTRRYLPHPIIDANRHA